MSYERVNWANEGETGAKPLDKTYLNVMDKGIYDLQNIELIAVSSTAPATCAINDKYYNTTTNKIYTATEVNTWGATGEDAIRGIFYLVISENATYYYNGTTLANSGETRITTGVEFATNEYIDGNRVYCKIIYFGNLPNNTTVNVAHNISNLNRVVNGFIEIKSTSVMYVISLGGGISPNSAQKIYAYVSGTNISIGTTSDESSFTAYVTMYYTKTQ